MADKDLIKIKMEANMKERVLKVNFFPPLQPLDLQQTDEYLRTLIGGTNSALTTLLMNIPTLRPATELEKEHNLYIYKDPVHDNNLAKVRMGLYRNLQEVFNATLKTYFSDVIYIEKSEEHQQNIIFDMDEKAIEDHKIEVAEITRIIRESKDEVDNDGDVQDINQ